MAAGDDWSIQEVAATVSDYMAMLTLELAGQPYNKTTHRRSLLEHLNGRSSGAVELKHQNISAVLSDLGHFWIPGYKPRSNYQRILAQEVEHWLSAHVDFDRRAIAAAEAPAAVPELSGFEGFEVPKPQLRLMPQTSVNESQAILGVRERIAFRRDYVAREARNSSLGQAGEELAFRFEQDRLSRAGYDHLANKVEHVSKTQGDGLGFDILSFEPSGKERFIEVKTTAFSKETPFFASSSEVRFAQEKTSQFYLYRLFEFKKNPRCFTLPGAFHDHCTLEPFSFRCSFR